MTGSLSSRPVKLLKTRASSTIEPVAEIINPLLLGAVADALQARENVLVDALVAGQLRRRVTGARQSVLRFFDVTLLDRSVATCVKRERAGETTRRRLVLIGVPRRVTELHRDRVSHLVRDDAEARHVTVGAKRLGGTLHLSGD